MKVEKETKFGYGFALAGWGLPAIVEKIFGPVVALVIAAMCTVGGIWFLCAAHFHKEPNTGFVAPKRSRPSEWLVTAILVMGCSVALGFAVHRVAKTQAEPIKAAYSELDWARVGPLKIVHPNEHSEGNDVYQIFFNNFGHLKAKQVGYLVTVTV